MFTRFDYYSTLYIMKPFLNNLKNRKGKRIPILMYHSISDDPETNVKPFYRINTSGYLFEEQMKYLKENNYSSIYLDDLQSSFEERSDKKNVIITFDDGYRDFYLNAFPVLQKYGYTAVVFLPTGFISRERKIFNDRECLTWNEVRELHALGIQFGSHTENHQKLIQLSDSEISAEIKNSLFEIEQNLGTKIKQFCYPYAYPELNTAFRINFKSILNSFGIEYSTTTMIGTTKRDDDFLELKRIHINNTDDFSIFGAKLEGYYDWVHYLQYVSKWIKKTFSDQNNFR